MPNHFTLTRKSVLPSEPVKLVTIDEEMCRHFGVPCDSEKWYMWWYDIIGIYLACGWSWDRIRKDGITVDGPSDHVGRRLLEIVDWLESNYTVDCWATIGK